MLFNMVMQKLGERNTIVSVYNQGAGGNGNILKEIIEPASNH